MIYVGESLAKTQQIVERLVVASIKQQEDIQRLAGDYGWQYDEVLVMLRAIKDDINDLKGRE